MLGNAQAVNPPVDWRRRFRRELCSLVRGYVGAFPERTGAIGLTEPEVWECAKEYATRKAPLLSATTNN